MSHTCEDCGAENVEDRVIKRLSSGYGRANKSIKHFCSRECRAWWRRRESDQSGAWEQPGPKGYQGRLDRFRDDDDDHSEQLANPSPAEIGGHDGQQPAEV